MTGTEGEIFVVTTSRARITRYAIRDLTRVTLARARGIARLIPPERVRIIRVTDLAEVPSRPPAWESAGTDEPRDKQRDLSVPGYWALVGPEYPDGWSWNIIRSDDGETAASAHVRTEAEAVAAAEAWELDPASQAS